MRQHIWIKNLDSSELIANRQGVQREDRPIQIKGIWMHHQSANVSQDLANTSPSHGSQCAPGAIVHTLRTMRHQRHTEQNEQCDIGAQGWDVAVERFGDWAGGGYVSALLRTREHVGIEATLLQVSG